MNNIRRFINRNSRSIWTIIGVIVFVFFIIKLMNSYYEKNEENNQNNNIQNNVSSQTMDIQDLTERNYTVKSSSVKITFASFVNYCNKRELEKAYAMLTEECKEAMFPTIEDFERIYINKIYNIKRTYGLVKWSTEGNRSTYLLTLYGDLLATGSTEKATQEYVTLVQDEKGIYKLNINNYIYGKDKNITGNVKGITVKIEHVDVYEDHEEVQITIINNTSKKILITDNKNNIYLGNSKGLIYESLNTDLDNGNMIVESNDSQTFRVEFNKIYSSTSKADYLALQDIILDYESFINSGNKENYTNKTSIKLRY